MENSLRPKNLYHIIDNWKISCSVNNYTGIIATFPNQKNFKHLEFSADK